MYVCVWATETHAGGGGEPFVLGAIVISLGELDSPHTPRIWRLVRNLLLRPKLYFRSQRLSAGLEPFVCGGSYPSSDCLNLKTIIYDAWSDLMDAFTETT